MKDKPDASIGIRTIRRMVLSLAATMLMLAFCLFLPAENFGWANGWIFIGAFMLLMILSSVYLWRTNPELLAARSTFHRGTKNWDKVVFFFLELAFLAVCWVASLDAGRFHWSSVPIWLIGIGYVVWTIGLVMIDWAMSVNKFAEITVRIQTERGHKVVDTGPYAIVRHPFYVGALFWLGGIPLSLGSLWAMMPAAFAALVLVVRTALEDRMLQNELPGYKEYAARVRCRLIPGVW